MYRGMLLIRLLDERLMTMQRQGRVGFYAEARGQEATVIGPVAALEQGDWVVPSHREGGAALFRGLPLQSYIAQVFGNVKDIGKGRQMPVHPAAPRALRFLPISSCVATQLPQATGIAWAAKIKGDKTVVLAYLGEGATSAEDFHTGVNFAAVFKVPVVFICVNNGWAVSTPASAQSASETFAVKALAYGIPGVRVDGNDLFAVHAATREAVDRARRGEGATLIEAVTYRVGAHSSSDDPARYRAPEESEAWAGRDPLTRFATWLNARRHPQDRRRSTAATGPGAGDQGRGRGRRGSAAAGPADVDRGRLRAPHPAPWKSSLRSWKRFGHGPPHRRNRTATRGPQRHHIGCRLVSTTTCGTLAHTGKDQPWPTERNPSRRRMAGTTSLHSSHPRHGGRGDARRSGCWPPPS